MNTMHRILIAAIGICLLCIFDVDVEAQDQLSIPSARAFPDPPAGAIQPTGAVQPAIYATSNQEVSSAAHAPEFPLLINQQDSADNEAEASNSSTSPIMTVSFSLAIVLGLFAGLVWVTRKFGTGNVRPGGMPSDVLQNLGSARLDSRTRVTMLKCGNRIVVVAQTTTGIHQLCEITDPDEVQSLAAACMGESSPSFAETLQRVKHEPAQPTESKSRRLFASA